MSNKTWGNWELRVEIMCIEHSVNGYQISLDECLTSAQVLDWVFQMRAKTWVTSEEMANLLDAFDDVFEPQSRLCSVGRNKSLTKEEMHRLAETAAQRKTDLKEFSNLFAPTYRDDAE
ncbi:hypothetical protein [Brevibacterium sp. FAM 24630]|uniref:hypothetical protein n=1 Tax=Brevibacterium sp. FAM 24630 TaxID=3415680 RepID=UPI003C7A63F1